MEKLILGIDIGTTSVKTILISSAGKIVDETTQDHDLLSAHPGWAEEDALVWWQDAVATVKRMAERHPEMMASVRGIGVSGMVPAIVMLDEKGEPVRNTIQQNDARAVEQIRRVKERLDQAELFGRTGGYTNQQHVIPRLLWVKEQEPSVYERTRWVMGSYDYIVYQLTGKRSVEWNWAVESGMFDIRRKEWITEYMEPFGIRPSLFPEVHASDEIVGTVSEAAAALTGLPAGIPVIAGAADHVASTLAAGIIHTGDLLIKFGGAGDILYCVDEIRPCDRLFFDYHIVPGKYLLNGCMAASGSLVKWYLKNILGEYDGDVLKRLDQEAEKVPAASEGLIILPYFVGEKTPIFDPEARGVLFGLTLAHQRQHIFRAVLESVIYGFRHHVDVLKESGYRAAHIYATNGGAKSSFWCQIAADVLGRTVTSYPTHPGSALGVAFLAGMKTGVFSQWEQIREFLGGGKVYHPNPENVKIYDKSYEIYRGLYEALKGSCQAVQKLYKE